MKNSKIALAALMALMMFSYTKAEEIKIDFDGINLEGTKQEKNSPSPLLEEITEQINWNEFPLPEKSSECAPGNLKIGREYHEETFFSMRQAFFRKTLPGMPEQPRKTGKTIRDSAKTNSKARTMI